MTGFLKKKYYFILKKNQVKIERTCAFGDCQWRLMSCDGHDKSFCYVQKARAYLFTMLGNHPTTPAFSLLEPTVNPSY